jgi:hypothetical protein
VERIGERSRRISRFRRGDLVSSGLGEAAYYLKKAKQNLSFAIFGLENADFDEAAEVLKGEDLSVESLTKKIAEMIAAVNRAEGKLIVLAEDRDRADV